MEEKKDICRGCGETFLYSELFELDGYDGLFCTECQLEIECYEMEYVDEVGE